MKKCIFTLLVLLFVISNSLIASARNFSITKLSNAEDYSSVPSLSLVSPMDKDGFRIECKFISFEDGIIKVMILYNECIDGLEMLVGYCILSGPVTYCNVVAPPSNPNDPFGDYLTLNPEKWLPTNAALNAYFASLGYTINYTVSPNPASSLINVNTTGTFGSACEVKITSIDNPTIQLVKPLPTGQSTLGVDILSLSNGTYILTIICDGHVEFSTTIVKN